MRLGDRTRVREIEIERKRERDNEKERSNIGTDGQTHGRTDI